MNIWGRSIRTPSLHNFCHISSLDYHFSMKFKFWNPPTWFKNRVCMKMANCVFFSILKNNEFWEFFNDSFLHNSQIHARLNFYSGFPTFLQSLVEKPPALVIKTSRFRMNCVKLHLIFPFFAFRTAQNALLKIWLQHFSSSFI